ncbi:MAG: 2-hydroxyacyl-CoA dehydratase family protein [Smithellaceae bacterium]
MENLTPLKAIVDNPYAYLQKRKDQHAQKIVGYVCSYAPEEFIHAAGALPVRLFGSDSGIHRADLHLQSYCCSLARGILEEALSGHLDVLDGVIFPHTCDTMQRLSDIWRLNLPQTFHADVVLPVKLNSPTARNYLADVLRTFRHDLEQKLGRSITDADLASSIRLYNAIRERMQRLFALRREYPHLLPGRAFYVIIRAAMLMEREAFLDSLQGIVLELDAKAAGQSPSAPAKRIVLSGGICSHPDIYDAIEQAGGVVTGDDLCTGERYFEGKIDEQMDPLLAIAKRIYERPVCPAKHSGLTDRGENLMALMKASKADGVIFLLLKFCDPHAFDYPYIKDMLACANMPSLLLEMEDQAASGGQLQTRLETFIQIL